MNLKFKIFLVTSNHITGNLIALKMKSYGHDVTVAENDSLPGSECVGIYDLLVLDNQQSDTLQDYVKTFPLPVLLTGKSKIPDLHLDDNFLSLTFNEEEFLHKVTYLTDKTSYPKEAGSLLDSVVSHYGGDKVLAGRVIETFLAALDASLCEIETSFNEDDDKVLGRKVHSFKGVLSALGETEASAQIRKLEILIKGRSRTVAQKLFPKVKVLCEQLSTELESSLLSL